VLKVRSREISKTAGDDMLVLAGVRREQAMLRELVEE
jgi:hypothetical protein